MCTSSKPDNLYVYNGNDDNMKLINDYGENCQNNTQEISQCLCPKTNIECKSVTNDVICKFITVSINININIHIL